MRNVNAEGTDFHVVRADLDMEFAAMARLDPMLRYLVQEAPLNISAQDTLDLQREWGIERTARYLRSIFEDMAPGWAPIRVERARRRG